MSFRPRDPFNVPMYIMQPVYTKVKGVNKKGYPVKGDLFYGSFKTFGGTEVVKDGVIVRADTAVIETWYRPDIKADCAIQLAESGQVYEILGTPENIEMRNQFLKFKAEAVAGGA